ncbi:MAG: WG repeat-containing protein [Faecousia sp.]
MAISIGVDVKTLSSKLGHFSAGFTLDTYTHTHITNDMLRRSAASWNWLTITTKKIQSLLQYWCENEAWGTINQEGQEIVPCRFDEIYEVEGTDRLYFVHEGGWESGHFSIYDVQEQKAITGQMKKPITDADG